MRKPDADIFEYVINNEELVPSETLFVDDFEENINTAASTGLHVYHLQHPETMKDLFTE
jgi:putative hydrolase of the HAD superfamily